MTHSRLAGGNLLQCDAVSTQVATSRYAGRVRVKLARSIKRHCLEAHLRRRGSELTYVRRSTRNVSIAAFTAVGFSRGAR
jgi:hypothetical protein